MISMAEKKGRDFDEDVADKILDELLAGESVGRDTKKAKITRLAAKIKRLQETKGYTWARITEELSRAGDISKDTLRHAVTKAQKDTPEPAVAAKTDKKKNPVVSTPARKVTGSKRGTDWDLGG